MKRTTIILLILAIIPYLFMTPLLCYKELSPSDEENYSILALKIIILRIIISKIMSGIFILPVGITYTRPFEKFIFLEDIPKDFNIPIFPSVKDKPPQFL